MPNLSLLVLFTKRSALNLHWLLAGEGPMLRPNDVSTPEGQLVGVLEGYLRSFEGAEPHEALQVWAKLSILIDNETGLPGIFRAALEGVRPVYRRLLDDYRDFDRAQKIMAGWTRAWTRAKQDEWDRRLGELFETVSQQVRRRGEQIVVNGPERILLRTPKPAGDHGSIKAWPRYHLQSKSLKDRHDECEGFTAPRARHFSRPEVALALLERKRKPVATHRQPSSPEVARRIVEADQRARCPCARPSTPRRRTAPPAPAATG